MPQKKENKGKPGAVAAAEETPVREKKKEKRSQKDRPRSKKKHTKVQVWKLYSIKGDSLERKNQNCPRCGPGTFLANYKNRRYCGKCGWAIVQQAAQ